MEFGTGSSSFLQFFLQCCWHARTKMVHCTEISPDFKQHRRVLLSGGKVATFSALIWWLGAHPFLSSGEYWSAGVVRVAQGDFFKVRTAQNQMG